jgi:hypothetical protein
MEAVESQQKLEVEHPLPLGCPKEPTKEEVIHAWIIVIIMNIVMSLLFDHA